MADQGKLEKMLILAFETSTDAESGGKLEAKASFEALVNPETYTLEYKVKTAEGQGQGTSGAQQKFAYTMPEELGFEFLFDSTGIIDGKPNKDGVFEQVDAFRKLLTEYRPDSHEPFHLKLIWGNLIFKGRAVELGITYKLFNPDGQPIRAMARVKFKGSIEEKKRIAKEDRRSPDLTHVRVVRAGDQLPLMCFRVYGDPRHYLAVANANGLSDFRKLTPGQTLQFPPLSKGGPPA
ncbi:MAG: LysM peptidoglycan-binding domain-containing protein [Pseudomonadota bacterium]